MHNRIYNFLTAGLIPTDLPMLRTLMMVNAFLLIGAITFAIFAYSNLWVFNDYFIGSIDAIASFVSILALIDLRLNQRLNRTVIIGTINFFIFFLTFSYTNQNNDFGLIWTIFFPIFVITLMGHKKGLMITAIFYMILFSMAFHNIGIWDNGEWSLRGFLRFTIASLVLTYVVYIYEAALDKSNITLLEIREKEARYLKELELLSMTDPLTGLGNRRRMDEILERQFTESKRYKDSFGIIMFDIDNFKMINDMYGHNVGDEVLIEITKIATASLRKTDHIARWGGEEFLIAIPKATLEETQILAEKIRKRIEEGQYPHDVAITCSFGVTMCDSNLDIYTLVDQADNALYHAKREGKNCVCVFYETAINASSS